MKKNPNDNKKEEMLLTFIQRTKDGYTKISSIEHIERSECLRDDFYDNAEDDSFFYSLRCE
jgi:hypothetical protein